MKKPFIIVLCFCYILVSCGVTINLHYCGSKLKKASILEITEEGCCGDKEKSNGCCKDKSAFLKIKDDYKLGTGQKIANNYSLISIIETKLHFCIHLNNRASGVINYHAPPVFYDNPIYLKNKVFII